MLVDDSCPSAVSEDEAEVSWKQQPEEQQQEQEQEQAHEEEF